MHPFLQRQLIEYRIFVVEQVIYFLFLHYVDPYHPTLNIELGGVSGGAVNQKNSFSYYSL